MAMPSTENDINQQVDCENITDEFASILSQESKIIIHSGFDVNKILTMMWVLSTCFQFSIFKKFLEWFGKN